MLGAADRLRLCDGVRLVGATLDDEVRSRPFPLNPTGRAVVESCGLPLDAVAAELARRYRLDEERARDDVLAFAYRLNRLLLVNVQPSRGRLARVGTWLAGAVQLLPAARLPATAWRRVRLDTRSGARAALDVVRAAAGRGLGVALAASALGAQAAALAQGVPPWDWLVVGLAVGAGLVLHEAGHALALGGVPAGLVLAGPRTFVVHAALDTAARRLVAAAGPAVPAALGVLVATAARPLQSLALALGGCALGGHAVGLTVATSDGRAACAD